MKARIDRIFVGPEQLHDLLRLILQSSNLISLDHQRTDHSGFLVARDTAVEVVRARGGARDHDLHAFAGIYIDVDVECVDREVVQRRPVFSIVMVTGSSSGRW